MAFALPPLVVVLLVLAAAPWIPGRLVQPHPREQLRSIESLQVQVRALQGTLGQDLAARRGFLLTRDPAFLREAARAREEEERLYRELRSLAQGLDPEVEGQLAELGGHLERWRGLHIPALPGTASSLMTLHVHAQQSAFRPLSEAVQALDRAVALRVGEHRQALGAAERVSAGVRLALAALAACVALLIPPLFRRWNRAVRLNREMEELAMRLRTATVDMLRVSNPEDAARMAVYHGVAALRASSGLAALLSTERRELRITTLVGTAEDGLEGVGSDLRAPSLLAEAVRTRSPVWITSRAERHRLHPAIPVGSWEDEAQTWGVVPLLVGEVALGVLAFGFRDPEALRPVDREFVLALAQICSTTVQHVRLGSEVEQAVRLRSGLLATMSRELRIPLTAVIGYAELLAMGIPEPIPRICRSEARRIQQNAEKVLEVIEEVLTYLQVDAVRETVQPVPVSLEEAAEEVLAIVGPAVASKGLHLHLLVYVPSPQRVELDWPKVRQVLLHLLSNAVEFTDAGTVELTVRQVGSEVIFQVRDTGIGIGPEEREHLFEPFWKADSSRRREPGGNGLGLAVARRLVCQLGGEITVESEPGRGSTFTVRLPLGRSAEAAVAAPPALAAGPMSHR